ncbi:MAG: dioxygenase [Desulfobacter sp.]|nr:MAG: dioxygenase [Desulfobacter sp.]
MARQTILYIPHGGGPLPLMGHDGHRALIRFLKQIHQEIPRPEAVLVISAHWEADAPTVTAQPSPDLLFDYYGFPPETYSYTYPAPGHPVLAARVNDALEQNGLSPVLDPSRGFDHGMFVPMKLIYPKADIPCVQLSLIKGLDPLAHIRMGKALGQIEFDNLLVLGSGFSFHNMAEFGREGDDDRNTAFDNWLYQVLSDPSLAPGAVNTLLAEWEKAPSARYCHPREEHLLPLHVCYGMAQRQGRRIFNGNILGKLASAYLWET